MILLDTDHVTVLSYSPYPRGAARGERLRTCGDERVVFSVVSLEEQLRGWLAEINRQRDVHDQPRAYERLASMIGFFSRWELVPFERRAADEFERLRKEKIRIGTQDLKIACVASVHDALLLSANLRDFGKVPGLRVENWLE